MKTWLFTPKDKFGKRVVMSITTEDHLKVKRTQGLVYEVTDQTTGNVYAIKTAPCGLPNCYCDAVITGIVEPVTNVYINEKEEEKRPFKIIVNGKIYREYTDRKTADRVLSHLSKEKQIRFTDNSNNIE